MYRILIALSLLVGQAVTALAQGQYLWSNNISTRFSTYSITYDSYAGDIVIDPNGNAYVAGSYRGEIIDTAGQTLLSCGAGQNAIIAKVNPYGAIDWIRQVDGSGSDTAFSVTLDAALNCYITGVFADSLILDGELLALASDFTVYPDSPQLFVMKFDADGNLIWHFTPNYATNRSRLTDLVVDEFFNCYAVGSFQGKIELAGDTLNSGYSYYESALTIKLNPEGVVLWAKSWRGSASEEASTSITKIGRSANGGLVLAGGFASSLIMDSDTLNTIADNASFQDALLCEISSQGDVIWSRNYGLTEQSPSGSQARITQMVTAQDGTIYVAGHFIGGMNGGIMEIGDFILTTGHAKDLFYAKFTADGEVVWARSMAGINTDDLPFDLRTDRDGNLWMTIRMSQTNGFVNTSVSTPYSSYPGTIKIDRSNGYLLQFEHTFPANTVDDDTYVAAGQYPKLAFDSYGNRYYFGNGYNSNLIPFNLAPTGLFIAKKSSGDITFSGQVFHDEDLNTLIDSTEALLPNVIIVGDSGLFYLSTDQNGRYEIPLDTSEHVFQVVPPPYWYTTYPTAPFVQAVSSPYSNDSILDLNFGLSMIPGIIDVRVSLTSTRAIPGFTTKIYLHFENVGTEPIPSGTIDMSYDETLSFLAASLPTTSQTGNVLTWAYDDLNVGESRQIEILFQVPADPDLLGLTLTSHASITPLELDTNQVNNTNTVYRIIQGSFDPNFKENTPKGLLEPGYITPNDTAFKYEIHFQNTGTDTAYTVVLVDTIPPNIDITTFDMIGSSHPFTYQVSGPGIVTWTFENILLPDSGTDYIGSQGFVTFAIRTLSGLPGTVFKNTAHIYFDFNPAVVTNTKVNTIYDCSSLVYYFSETAVCIGDEISGFAVEELPSDLTWNINQIFNSSDDTLYWLTDTVGEFQLQVNRAGQLCLSDTTVIIEVATIPNVSIGSALQDTVCLNSETIELSGASPLGGSFIGTGVVGDSFVPEQAGLGTHQIIYTYSESSGPMCSDADTTTITVLQCVGIDDRTEITGVHLFPNPTTGLITVIMPSQSESTQMVELYDATMRLLNVSIVSPEEGYFRLDITNYTKGIYFVKVVEKMRPIWLPVILK